MCSGTLPNPRNWNRELHDIAGCDHDSPTARRLDSFLNDFMMAHHYNRAAEPVETHPLKAFTVTRRVAAEWNEGDCCNECGGSLHVDGHTETCSRRATFLPLGCHNPIAHVNLLRADVVPCKFKFYTRPGYCTGFWVTRDGQQIHHYDNKTDAEANRDALNAISVFGDAPPAETGDDKTVAHCFAKGGYLVGQPQTTFGGIPVAPPIDLPPVELKPRVRGLASLRRSWRVR